MEKRDELGYTPTWYRNMAIFCSAIFMMVVYLMTIKHPEDTDVAFYPFVFVFFLGCAIGGFMRSSYLKKIQKEK